MMTKDELKQIKRGDLVYVDFGDKKEARGSEQHSRRPAIVIQNDKGNFYSPTTIVVPVTTSKTKRRIPTHVHIEEKYLEKIENSSDSMALLEQLKVIDKSRIIYHLETKLSEEKMKEIDKALSISVGL